MVTESKPYWEERPNTAPIKSEYVLWDLIKNREQDNRQQGHDDEEQANSNGDKNNNNSKRKYRGQNKGRTFDNKAGVENDRLCSYAAQGLPCERLQKTGECKWSHDISAYMKEKPEDIHPSYNENYGRCVFFEKYGKCPYGFKCRFGSCHIKESEDPETHERKYELITDEEGKESMDSLPDGTPLVRGDMNVISMDTIRKVRGQGVDKEKQFPRSKEFFNEIDEPFDSRENKKRDHNGNSKSEQLAREQRKQDAAPDLAKVRLAEKKRLHWKDKMYLAPLTTVGNLPFRRLCVTQGADITVSEMGMSQEFLSGNTSEWSLVRRHPSEKMFGIQLCGSRPQLLVPAGEALADNCTMDFVDVNCGCPIDLVFNRGGGSAMMTHANRLGQSLVGLSSVLGETPVTVKFRTGVTPTAPVAHKLIPRAMTQWHANGVVLHGRSRQQRYKTRADWDYIRQCVKAIDQASEEQDIPRIPIFGNGDCFDYRDYYQDLENTGVDGVMVARGALIKPWIFTEIKEKRDWDISSRERLDMIGQLASYGLEHWGSDTMGINNARRFLCESLSFMHRYIPIGILEHLPVSMNDRPFPYQGRDDLETLLSSPKSDDWIKISSMFFGPPPEGWTFTPKHKSSAG